MSARRLNQPDREEAVQFRPTAAPDGVSRVWRGSAYGVFYLLLVSPAFMWPTELQLDFEVAGDAYTKHDILRAIDWYAKRQRLDPLLLRAVIKAESDFRYDARSRKGALGLMQLMPSTVEQYHVDDPFDPLQNIRAGSRRLHHLVHRYNGDLPLALAAYNAGVHRVKDRRVPRIGETRRYVRKVLTHYHELQRHQSTLGPRLPRGQARRRPNHTVRATQTAATLEQSGSTIRRKPLRAPHARSRTLEKE